MSIRRLASVRMDGASATPRCQARSSASLRRCAVSPVCSRSDHCDSGDCSGATGCMADRWTSGVADAGDSGVDRHDRRVRTDDLSALRRSFVCRGRCTSCVSSLVEFGRVPVSSPGHHAVFRLLILLLVSAYVPRLTPAAMPESTLVLATLLIESPEAATLQRPDPAAEPFPETWLKGELNAKKEELTNIAEGIFKPWSKSPAGWVLGGSAPIALVDVWIRWWTFA
jgi:hypothetical protein